MRRITAGVAFLLAGCAQGAIRRKPGSDVVLPAAPNVVASLKDQYEDKEG